MERNLKQNYGMGRNGTDFGEIRWVGINKDRNTGWNEQESEILSMQTSTYSPDFRPVDPQTVADLAGRFGRGASPKNLMSKKSRAVMADVEIVPSFKK